jgi:dihydrofolate reductase
MTLTQYFVAASVDGYIADSSGSLDWLFPFDRAEGVAEHYRSFLSGVGAIAMGAATYEFIRGQSAEEWPYKDQPTWVFTHRALPVFAGADIRFTAAEVGVVHDDMKRAAGEKNIWLMGGGNLAAQFADRGLIDELLLGVMPVVLGAGAPLLPARIAGLLTLESITRFGMGALELRYRVPRP